ncbi:MAG: hypothetical protein A3H88_01795 [Candidatus Blackburnbacteria bacterium RIFCSPLOWO2_02_FULL_44_9]|uniref:Antitoxin n=1 Tax=Candidatus Blackburnbacteria bacterium RIFCSPHIGHO2_02_FULL_44_20 TaxID=1797516 RepID=A0A1G1VAB5_9BACT|nr:MAG: hypothetical protein A3E16_02560 [Candidatus Blackburnbacteria bacterium RIFCSPHIGHO2_12_FULL_44_25]OGY12207.1 MAG: hypothetical protein A3D26_01240 [Candidatus Blackburnbacteria bacterium RIFCSPHIGHO2_02_FULL_44_20]OGY15249.1 MAG: hypothetical protein A3A62_01160 [Candidatus Blackburnbacteria bacterium RIFCSPLOWO2_01_FULL_44_43]OGY16719.1 MAG: hypothetical protein A3H88_01795 [Candidatus Blackburnbacteria bacterium RIFCSPLOWO2_02_FULL_44_9]
MKTLPITKAREELPTLVDRADKLLEEYTITVNGQPKAVIISAKELDSLKETLDILSNSRLMADIKEGEEQIARGEYLTEKEFKRQTGW